MKARLTALKPTVGRLPPRLGPPPNPADRSPQREQAAPWRRWYKTARWRRLRDAVLLRDNYTCRQTGVLCGGKHPAPDSPVVDHIRPHRGDPRRFWDENNLQTVAKAYHDAEKQRLEQASLHTRGVWD